MKSFIAVILGAVLGVTGVCRADDVGPGQPLKAVLHEEDQADPNGLQYVGSVMLAHRGAVAGDAWRWSEALCWYAGLHRNFRAQDVGAFVAAAQ